MTIKEQIIELRKQGKSYGEIATELGISKETAYKYGRDVKIVAERKETQELEPTESVKEAFAKGIRKADSRAYMIRLLRDVAEQLGYGSTKKNKFVYDDSEYGLKCKEYEKVIAKTKGFILPDFQGILNFCFKKLMETIKEKEAEKSCLEDCYYEIILKLYHKIIGKTPQEKLRDEIKAREEYDDMYDLQYTKEEKIKFEKEKEESKKLDDITVLINNLFSSIEIRKRKEVEMEKREKREGEKLKLKLAEIEPEIERLETENKELKEDYNSLLDECKELKKENAALNRKIAVLEEEYASKKEILSQLEQRVIKTLKKYE